MQQREEPIKKPIFLCHISKLTGFYQKKKNKKETTTKRTVFIMLVPQLKHWKIKKYLKLKNFKII